MSMQCWSTQIPGYAQTSGIYRGYISIFSFMMLSSNLVVIYNCLTDIIPYWVCSNEPQESLYRAWLRKILQFLFDNLAFKNHKRRRRWAWVCYGSFKSKYYPNKHATFKQCHINVAAMSIQRCFHVVCLQGHVSATVLSINL